MDAGNGLPLKQAQGQYRFPAQEPTEFRYVIVSTFDLLGPPPSNDDEEMEENKEIPTKPMFITPQGMLFTFGTVYGNHVLSWLNQYAL